VELGFAMVCLQSWEDLQPAHHYHGSLYGRQYSGFETYRPEPAGSQAGLLSPGVLHGIVPGTKIAEWWLGFLRNEERSPVQLLRQVGRASEPWFGLWVSLGFGYLGRPFDSWFELKFSLSILAVCMFLGLILLRSGIGSLCARFGSRMLFLSLGEKTPSSDRVVLDLFCLPDGC
jgi:hypothetical protein